MCAVCIPKGSAELVSRSYSTYRGSCSTPFFSHSYEFCVCKLFRFTYFPKTVHLCQNNGFQSLKNHTLIHAVSPTPLESHTSKIRGWGEGGIICGSLVTSHQSLVTSLITRYSSAAPEAGYTLA